MTPELDRAIREGLCACFPADVDTFRRTRAWHGSVPAFSVLVGDERLVIAHLGVVERVIRVGEQNVNIAGVQNVFVRPEYRGNGLVDRILRVSMDEALQRRIDVGMLFCLPVLEKIYARNGWIALPYRQVHATRSNGERYVLDEKNILMFHPLIRRDFPEGSIDLCGDDW